MASKFKNALLIGASSGIGAALARCFAEDGTRVALVARRPGELENVRRGIATAWGEDRVRTYVGDVTEYDAIPALFAKIDAEMEGLDLVIYCAGVMCVGPEDEYDFVKDKQVVEVNLLGGMAWLNQAAARFEGKRAGAIVGIGSVAGDRGRRAYPNYHAAKAGFATYLESLRNRLSRYGVKVTTIKPGPVATPMTEGLGKQPLMQSAEEAAQKIHKAILKGKMTSYIPAIWWPIMFMIRSIPSILFRRMGI
jgi:short-subunit dehydrogenase